MDREQAIKIQERLFEAATALDRARMLVAGLGKQELAVSKTSVICACGASARFG
jgi:hypothetical protein